VGKLEFRELPIPLARTGEEYVSTVTGNWSVEASTDATAKLGADSKPNPKAELMSALGFDFIP
jgi:hypothetical protein